MGFFGKKKLSELDASGQFVVTIMKRAEQHWPAISEEINEFFQFKAASDDAKYVAYEVALAVIATQIQALPNLLQSDQAERIHNNVLYWLAVDEIGSYPAEALQEYQHAWDKSLRQAEIPVFGIASVLFDKLLGYRSAVQISDNASPKGPLSLAALSRVLVVLGGSYWKDVVREYKLVR